MKNSRFLLCSCGLIGGLASGHLAFESFITSYLIKDNEIVVNLTCYFNCIVGDLLGGGVALRGRSPSTLDALFFGFPVLLQFTAINK